MRLALLALLLAGTGCKVGKLPDVTKPAPAYPRAATYAAMWSSGAPLVREGAIDSAYVRQLARYDYIVLEPFRVGINADAQRYLRSLNPRMTLLAYVPAGRYFVCGEGWAGGEPPLGCDTTGANMRWSLYTVARAHNAILWGKSGKPYQGFYDFAQPGFAEALAESVAAWVTPWASGCFVDETCVTGIRWSQGADSVDYRRAGYESYDAWESAYRAGWAAFYMRLRALMGQRLIVGNCGPVGDPAANGWMIENFPFQRGGTVSEYLARETTYTAPRLNWLTAWMSGEGENDAASGDGEGADAPRPSGEYRSGAGDTGDAPLAVRSSERRAEPVAGTATQAATPSPDDLRRARYALGVATLGEGVAAATWSANDVSRGTWGWLPELSPKGWLGLPLGPAVRGKDGLWRRAFTGGSVEVDETKHEATFTRVAR